MRISNMDTINYITEMASQLHKLSVASQTKALSVYLEMAVREGKQLKKDNKRLQAIEDEAKQNY